MPTLPASIIAASPKSAGSGVVSRALLVFIKYSHKILSLKNNTFLINDLTFFISTRTFPRMYNVCIKYTNFIQNSSLKNIAPLNTCPGERVAHMAGSNRDTFAVTTKSSVVNSILFECIQLRKGVICSTHACQQTRMYLFPVIFLTKRTPFRF